MRWTTGLRVGRLLVMTHPATEEDAGPGEQTTLYVLWRDFRTVLVQCPWPRWMWPWRRWWIDAWRLRLAYRLGPRWMQERAEDNERFAGVYWETRELIEADER